MVINIKIIGVTGGVGSGKSKVLDYIKNNYNALIILTDEVAKNLEKRGEVCYEKIINTFGKTILNDKLEIDKNKLADIIFNNEMNLKLINNIVHPEVKKYILNIINNKTLSYDYIFIESAILIEAGYKEIIDELWYIYVKEDIRRERLKSTRNYSDNKIDNIMKKQLSENEFKKNADVIIDNTYNFLETIIQIKEKL